MIRKRLMFITDVGMLLYWIIATLMALSIINIPSHWLFNDYQEPALVAWNWSFFPLDMALSVTGLYALHLERNGHLQWRHWAIISLTLTFCAGFMAISYWLIAGDFSLAWWVPNLFLMVWPLFFLWQMSKD